MNATAQGLCRLACELGLHLEAKGDSLSISPAAQVPPGLAHAIHLNKPAVLEWLKSPLCARWQAVPPYNLALARAKPHPKPEDLERVIHFLLRQTTGGTPQPLTTWLVRRENDYYAGPGRKWDCALNCYAACRDAACWQLNRNERDVIDLIVSFESHA